MFDLSSATDIAVIITGLAAIASIWLVIRFETSRQRGEREDRMRAKLERASIALVTLYQLNIAKKQHGSGFFLFRLFGSDIPLTIGYAIAVRNLLAATFALRTEKQSAPLWELLDILHVADSVDTQEASDAMAMRIVTLNERILDEIAHPPSWWRQIRQRFQQPRTKKEG